MADQTADAMLREFVEKMVEEQHLSTADAAVKQQIVTDLMEEAEALIHAKIIEALMPNNLEAFEALLDRNATDEEVKAFLGDHIPNYGQFLATALLEFRQTYLNPSEV